MLAAAGLVTVLVPLLVLVVVFAALVAGAFGMQNLLQRMNRRAMDRVPAKLTLKEMSKPHWRDPTMVTTLSSPITYRGFKDRGTFTVKELPSVTLKILYNKEESAVAVLFEHPGIGHWVEITSYYVDGTTACYSTGNSGMVVRPGHFRVAGVGLNAGAIFTRFKLERPKKPMMPVTEDSAQSLFLQAYADEATWRKSNGKTPIAFAFAGRSASRRRAAS